MPHIRLLIADQDQHFTGNLKKYLDGKPGISTECCCGSGNEIICRIAAIQPDIVIQALVFDELDGLKILEYMKSMHKRPSAIVCTNFHNDTMLIRARSCGARYFFCKPVFMDSIYEAIRDCVRKPYTPKEAELCGERTQTPLHIETYLDSIGVSQKTEGYKLLCSAVKIAQTRPDLLRSMGRHFYPELARLHNSTPAKVERNIRSCLSRAYKAHARAIREARLSNKEFIRMIAESLHISIE